MEIKRWRRSDSPAYQYVGDENGDVCMWEDVQRIIAMRDEYKRNVQSLAMNGVAQNRENNRLQREVEYLKAELEKVKTEAMSYINDHQTDYGPYMETLAACRERIDRHERNMPDSKSLMIAGAILEKFGLKAAGSWLWDLGNNGVVPVRETEVKHD